MKNLLSKLCLISIPLTLMTSAISKAEAATLYEAENGTLNGVSVVSSVAGYSGTGYVTGFDAGTDTLTITVNTPQQALYDITIGYRSEYGEKYTRLAVNGNSLGEVFLPTSTSFSETAGGRALLNSGANQISIANHWGYYDIDYIKIQAATTGNTHPINRTLSNPNTSAQTKSLFNYLADKYGQAILSGQQNTNDNLSHVTWLQSVTGKKPAVVGFDLMDYSPSRVENGAASSEVEHSLAWDSQGGIVTFVWHWNAPSGIKSTCQWWEGFYTSCTTFDVAYALANPASADYQLLLRDMDAIAVQLQRLENAGVPVLFRPLHEAEGAWFWWGAKGAGPTKQLYRLMHDRFTNYHHLDNLIWVWNSITPEWYPGNDVVDIVSADDYAAAGDYGPVYSKYESLKTLVNDSKMVALTENGPIPDPDLLQVYGAHWSWFSTWSGNFLTDGSYNSQQHLNHVFNHAYVITLDELPDIKTYQSTPGTQPPAATGMKVQDVTMAMVSQAGKTWATARVMVTDNYGNPVANVAVNGHWSGKTNDTESGMTGADGTVLFSSNQVNNPGKGTYTFSIDVLAHSTLSYTSNQNLESSDSITK